MDMDPFLYFFSASAQVLAAISALLAVLSQFKLNELREFLVGDGVTILSRWDSERYDYHSIANYLDRPTRTQNRLRDSCERKNVERIYESILELKVAQEKSQIINNETGFNHVEQRYRLVMKQFFYLESSVRRIVVVGSIGILLSLLSILAIPLMEFSWIVGAAAITVIDLVLVLLLTGLAVFRGLTNRYMNLTSYNPELN